MLHSTTAAYIRIATQEILSQFSVKLLLHGIGHSGDNANPAAFSLSNQHPLRPERPVTIQILAGDRQIVATVPGTVRYADMDGNFVGTTSASTTIPPGTYLVNIQSDQYLRKNIPGIITVTDSMTTILPQLDLVAGDSVDDNQLNILDYNMILDCYTGDQPARACGNTAKQLATDATDDGVVNQYDYNLFLRELSVQHGD